jgi:predicted ATPase/class 3 adenylate cyclase
MCVSDLPTGTVTFLFTDLEESTRLWREHPEAMKVALARHDALVEEAIVAADGVVVKKRGDGYHAVFRDPGPAVDAAVAAQLALSAEEWPIPMRARMGIHTGPAELRDGDYYGTPVNRAARVMSAAHGGQIVVSHATEELVADGHTELLDLGEHALRDLGRRERLFQVVHPELDHDFPPLTSLAAFAGNLPVQVTSFVGRDDDVARVVALLGESRLVTLAGTGGVGKTRLAVQVAAEVLPRFSDGAWICELAAADDAEAMVQVVASTLGCVQHPGLSLSASIVEYLRVRELLLVLDNCEQVLDDASEFAAAVVQGCPQVTVIATSREALDHPGERVVRVRSLETPSNDADLLDVASVRLFRDRADDAGADLEWDARQWSAVAEICRRVDGIPLAIELAAARAVSMNPIDVAGHLDERFRLLTGKRRGRVERHQTLRATVEWSYHLLSLEEQAVFDRVGTFAGSFDASAATAVACGDELDAWTVTDALASLVAKSMLSTETGPDGATRYAMLETLRQYARERLDESGDTDRCRRELARHLGAVAREAGSGVMGPDDAMWLARIRAELDNMRAAVGWALDSDAVADQELGLRIVAPLAWMSENCTDLGLTALATQALPFAERSTPEIRTAILTLAAYDRWHLGDLDGARRLAERALEHGIIDTMLAPLDPYQLLVVVEVTAGNHVRAFELMDEVRALADAFEPGADLARILAGFATYEAMAGRLEAAKLDSQRALDVAERAGSEHLLANALNGRTWALQRDDPVAALAAADQFLDAYRRSGVARGVAPGLMALAGGLRARLGDDRGALPVFADALVIARDDGTMPQAAGVLGFALNPLCRAGRTDVAATLIGAFERGALSRVGNFPGTADSRARTLERIREGLGDEHTATLVERGAAMSYNELITYALDHLDAPAV